MNQIETAALLDGHALDALLGRSLLTTQEWSDADLASVRAIARSLARLDRQGEEEELDETTVERLRALGGHRSRR